MSVVDPCDFAPDFVAELDRLLRLRRDVRRFRTDAIPAPLLEETLASLETAPSVGLSQPWRLVFFDSDRARAGARAAFETANLEALAAQTPDDAAMYARLKLQGMDEAPTQFALFAEEDPAQGRGLGRRSMPEMTRYSAVCAAMQLWIAARARGLGLGWVSILDVDAIARLAQAEPNWRLIGYFCMGYPLHSTRDVPELEREGWERRSNPAMWRRAV